MNRNKKILNATMAAGMAAVPWNYPDPCSHTGYRECSFQGRNRIR